MSATELLNAVLQLPIEDRRELIHKAWESLGEDVSDDGLLFEDSSGFIEAIERRLQDAESDLNSLSDWEDVRERVRQRLANRASS